MGIEATGSVRSRGHVSVAVAWPWEEDGKIGLAPVLDVSCLPGDNIAVPVALESQGHEVRCDWGDSRAPWGGWPRWKFPENGVAS